MSRILLYQARRVPKNWEILKLQLIREQNQQKTRHSTFDVFLVCWLLLKWSKAAIFILCVPYQNCNFKSLLQHITTELYSISSIFCHLQINENKSWLYWNIEQDVKAPLSYSVHQYGKVCSLEDIC